MAFKFLISTICISMVATEVFGGCVLPPAPCAPAYAPACAPACAPAGALPCATPRPSPYAPAGPAKLVMKSYKTNKPPVNIDMKLPSQIPIGKFLTCQKISLKPSIIPTEIVDEVPVPAPCAASQYPIYNPAPAPAQVIRYYQPAPAPGCASAPVCAPAPVYAPATVYAPAHVYAPAPVCAPAPIYASAPECAAPALQDSSLLQCFLAGAAAPTATVPACGCSCK